VGPVFLAGRLCRPSAKVAARRNDMNVQLLLKQQQ
jgi:hypothetical protein